MHVCARPRFCSLPLLAEKAAGHARSPSTLRKLLRACVTSWNPLVVYLYEEGLARFATEAYSTDALEQRCRHLTNYSLNKHSKHFIHSKEEDAGSKWSLSAFKRRLASQLDEARSAEARVQRAPRLSHRATLLSACGGNGPLALVASNRSFIPAISKGLFATAAFTDPP
eukprot:6195544-Pleurochrysis_carterae.AAC.4